MTLVIRRRLFYAMLRHLAPYRSHVGMVGSLTLACLFLVLSHPALAQDADSEAAKREKIKTIATAGGAALMLLGQSSDPASQTLGYLYTKRNLDRIDEMASKRIDQAGNFGLAYLSHLQMMQAKLADDVKSSIGMAGDEADRVLLRANSLCEQRLRQTDDILSKQQELLKNNILDVTYEAGKVTYRVVQSSILTFWRGAIVVVMLIAGVLIGWLSWKYELPKKRVVATVAYTAFGLVALFGLSLILSDTMMVGLIVRARNIPVQEFDFTPPLKPAEVPNSASYDHVEYLAGYDTEGVDNFATWQYAFEVPMDTMFIIRWPRAALVSQVQGQHTEGPVTRPPDKNVQTECGELHTDEVQEFSFSSPQIQSDPVSISFSTPPKMADLSPISLAVSVDGKKWKRLSELVLGNDKFTVAPNGATMLIDAEFLVDNFGQSTAVQLNDKDGLITVRLLIANCYKPTSTGQIRVGRFDKIWSFTNASPSWQRRECFMAKGGELKEGFRNFITRVDLEWRNR